MISKEIKVICITSTTKLIKDAIYTVTGIYTSRYGSKKRTVYIDGVGTYSIDYFTLLNGESLQNISDFNKISYVDYEKNYNGQFVRCKYSEGCKSIKKGEIYFVEDKIVGIKKRSTRLKLRGVKIPLSLYRFEEIPVSEQRNLKLNKLNNQEIKTGEKTRKFLLYSEKEKVNIIFEILFKVSSDINKADIINTDIVKLILNKGKNYAINEEDINYYLNLKLNNIVERLV